MRSVAASFSRVSFQVTHSVALACLLSVCCAPFAWLYQRTITHRKDKAFDALYAHLSGLNDSNVAIFTTPYGSDCAE